MNKYKFFRVASCVPAVAVADCKKNAESIVQLASLAKEQCADLAVFPEMAVTAYTCADLFHSRSLIDDAKKAISFLADKVDALDLPPIIVGAPIEDNGALYNCAVLIAKGCQPQYVAKTFLPNYNEFYEKRWWTPAPINPASPLCANKIFCIGGVKVGIEICEDLWAPVPPSCHLAMAGAQVIANLSASDDLIGKLNYTKQLISQQSARCICAYVYASAGFGESSTDLVFDGKAIIAEYGKIIAANERWQNEPQMVVNDIDIEAIDHDRLINGTFNDCARLSPYPAPQVIDIPAKDYADRSIMRKIDPHPFVPPTDSEMAHRCHEIINIQAAGLAKRLQFIHAAKLVVGISGGLDSTLALLVAVKAFDRLKLPRTGIIGITMPGFGTTDRTLSNALQLMANLGVTSREISIAAAVTQHFSDIGQDMNNHDVAYENGQARERTQILMDVANMEGAIVLGTGDLSELALGWATYNGDHMSMYGVNASVPKTLVKYLVKYFAEDPDFASSRSTLLDIVDTPISPELIPADAKGNITQKTEDLVGPYPLHDFFLYHTLRHSFTPEKIKALAILAFEGQFSEKDIDKWLHVFIRRFFSQQFKRSCMPDGPKVGSVCLSPRGDWRMPSDAVPFAFE